LRETTSPETSDPETSDPETSDMEALKRAMAMFELLA
jgi:hypothetical protein